MVAILLAVLDKMAAVAVEQQVQLLILQLEQLARHLVLRDHLLLMQAAAAVADSLLIPQVAQVEQIAVELVELIQVQMQPLALLIQAAAVAAAKKELRREQTADQV
jgi:hypothetical protein